MEKNEKILELKKTMLTTKEAAEFLGFKVSYLHKLMMNRSIPYYKPAGKLCFFDLAEIDGWRRSVRITPQDEIDAQAQAYIINNRKG